MALEHRVGPVVNGRLAGRGVEIMCHLKSRDSSSRDILLADKINITFILRTASYLETSVDFTGLVRRVLAFFLRDIWDANWKIEGHEC